MKILFALIIVYIVARLWNSNNRDIIQIMPLSLFSVLLSIVLLILLFVCALFFLCCSFSQFKSIGAVSFTFVCILNRQWQNKQKQQGNSRNTHRKIVHNPGVFDARFLSSSLSFASFWFSPLDTSHSNNNKKIMSPGK